MLTHSNSYVLCNTVTESVKCMVYQKRSDSERNKSGMISIIAVTRVQALRKLASMIAVQQYPCPNPNPNKTYRICTGSYWYINHKVELYIECKLGPIVQ